MADQPETKPTLGGFWSHLFRLYEQEDRAALARLRRAVADPVDGDVFAVIGNSMPPKISGRDISDRQIDAHLLAACLFAVHPTTVSAESERYSLGASMRRLRVKLSVGGESLDARFAAILNSDREDLPSRLRHAIRLLASHDVPVHYPRLLSDLLQWGNEGRYVQRRWAIDYWTVRDADESDTGEQVAEPAEGDQDDA